MIKWSKPYSLSSTSAHQDVLVRGGFRGALLGHESLGLLLIPRNSNTIKPNFPMKAKPRLVVTKVRS